MARWGSPTYDCEVAQGGAVGVGRSTAVVLFTDLVGSTELRSRLGENAAEELRRKHDALVAGAVGASRGNLVKNLGDGIMATFAGASDAVGGAVAIQQAIGRHNRTSAASLEVRIGISAGDVVFEGDDCFGTPVIEAARLCGAASGGQILASEMVRWLARSSDGMFTPIGSLELKGLHEPVPAVQVDWEPLPQSSVPLPAFLTDIGRIFVGRDDELERLGQLWKEATAGELRIGFLAGEPGVGKTRLAAELAVSVHDEGATVLAGRCDEDLGVPYQPFVEALRHFVDHAPALSGRLGRYGGELARLVPELGERIPSLPAPLRSDPETERYRLFDAVAAWLAVASVEEPLLLVLDDLQWAAKPTLLLLRHVVRAGGGRVLLLCTYRDTELTHDHPLVEVVADLRRRGGVERLSLSGLDDVGVSAFVEQASGRTLDEAGVALALAVYEETEGNPFFVREVLRHLAETGAVERQEGSWTTRLPIDRLRIPEGVRDVVGRRLSRLSSDTNYALRIAAVVGPEFELDVVQAAGDLSEETLLGALEEAAGARLVTEVSATRFRFAHALVRATLYESLTTARKVTLHRKAAEAIETIHESALDDHLPALAHHYARAATPVSVTDRAVDYAARAGDRALAQLAHDEAVDYYRQALDLLEASEGVTDEARRLELLIALGEAQRRAGYPAHRATLLDAARLARHRGDARRMAQAALANSRGTFTAIGVVDRERVAALESALDALGHADVAVRARLLATLAVELLWAGDPGRRRALGDEALELARCQSDRAVLASVLALRWATLWDPRRCRERLNIATELLSIAEAIGDPSFKFWGLWRRAVALMELGEVAEAAASRRLAEAQAAELGQHVLRWGTLLTQVGAAVAEGRLTDAEEAAEAALYVAHECGLPDADLSATIISASIRYEQGRLGELEGALSDAVTRFPGVPFFRAMLALAYCEQDRLVEARSAFAPLAGGDPADLIFDYLAAPTAGVLATVSAELGATREAAALMDVIGPYADQLASNPMVWFGSFSHHLALLARALERFSDADAYFRTAAVTHERIGAPAWLARTRLEWARMLLGRAEPGDGERAHGLLRQALATAQELGLANIERGAVELLSSE
jgi:class 3 adenylate cyclase/tetratricopeptide (TPR) repeat protein